MAEAIRKLTEVPVGGVGEGTNFLVTNGEKMFQVSADDVCKAPDKTLSVEGAPADAAAVGAKIETLTVETVKAAVDEYVSENSGGFATKEDVDTLKEGFTYTENGEALVLGEELNGGTWTLNGWTGSVVDGFSTTADNTSSLELTIPGIAAGKRYFVKFQLITNVADVVGGLFSISLGGSPLFDTYEGLGGTNNWFDFGFVAENTNNLIITPLNSFVGTIAGISVREIVGISDSLFNGKNTDGEIVMESRADGRLTSIFVGTGAGQYNTGNDNTAVGFNALLKNISGYRNTAIGAHALKSNINGSRNTAIGQNALIGNTSGIRNTAIGQYALHGNTTGNQNIGIGADSMMSNKTGSENIAIGGSALGNNTEGNSNIGIGRLAAVANTSGEMNIAIGLSSLTKNTTGKNNIAIGKEAGRGIVTGGANIAIGPNSLNQCAAGNYNVAIGENALGYNTDHANIAIGYKAMFYKTSGGSNIAIGYQAYFSANGGSGEGNVVIGNYAASTLKTGNGNIILGTNCATAFTQGTGNIFIGRNLTPDGTTGNYMLNIGGLIKGSLASGEKYVQIAGGLQVDELPTTDPAIAGRVWNDNGTLKISTGVTA